MKRQLGKKTLSARTAASNKLVEVKQIAQYMDMDSLHGSATCAAKRLCSSALALHTSVMSITGPTTMLNPRIVVESIALWECHTHLPAKTLRRACILWGVVCAERQQRLAREQTWLSKRLSLKSKNGLRQETLKSTNSSTPCIVRKKLRGAKHVKLSREECARYVRRSIKRNMKRKEKHVKSKNARKG